MKILFTFTSLIFLMTNSALANQTITIVTGRQQKEILELQMKETKAKPIYYLQYTSANNGIFQRVLTKDIFEQMVLDAAKFKKIFSVALPINPTVGCGEQVQFKFDDVDHILCLEKAPINDKKLFKKWFKSESDFAIRRY